MDFRASVLGDSILALDDGLISMDYILVSGIIEFKSEFSNSLLSKSGPPSVRASFSDLLEFGWSLALEPNCSSGRSTSGCISGLLLLFLYFGSLPSKREDFFLRRLPTVDTGCFLSTFLLPEDFSGEDYFEGESDLVLFFSGFSFVSS